MKTKYMMNLRTIEAMNPEMYIFLRKEVNILWYTGMNTPIVDITTGKIYGSIVLDRDSHSSTDVRYRIVEAITTGEPVRGFYTTEKMYDHYGNNIIGHYFSDVGSIDLNTLRLLWKNYKKNAEEKSKLNKVKEEAKIESEKVIVEAKKKISEFEKLMKRAEEVLEKWGD